MSPSELTNTIVYVHRNEAHFTYIYVYHTNVSDSEADNIFKNPPPNVISPIFFAIFISLWGPMTLLTPGALTDPRLPATASNVCTTDARLGGVGRVPPPPQKNPGYAGASRIVHCNSYACRYGSICGHERFLSRATRL